MLRSFSMTDIGKRRKLNQDFVFDSIEQVGALPNLFLVADGMGGHRAGDFASRCAVETVVEEVRRSGRVMAENVLEEAIRKAHGEILQRAGEDERLTGMGTTLVAASVRDHVLTVANVGDSRLYVIGREIRQITRDHSLVEEMVRAGALDKSAARSHPEKNIVTRAIGGGENAEADFFTVLLQEGDLILLCSDGLTNMLEDEEIASICREEGTLEERAERLIEAANAHGGLDNIAVILVEPFVRGDSEVDVKEGRHD